MQVPRTVQEVFVQVLHNSHARLTLHCALSALARARSTVRKEFLEETMSSSETRR
jgi:hypothetical protein